MKNLRHFHNDGFGWICRKCETELDGEATSGHSRLLKEGEAESKKPDLSTKAIAQWNDEERTELVCPRCGATESI
jgi:ribosomal protein L40E